MASSSSIPDVPRVLVAAMIVGAKDGGIAFLMGRRQVGPEKGTWFFPSDELLPGEEVHDCVQRILKQVDMTLKYTWDNKILDHLPADPLVCMEDTLATGIDEMLWKSTTVFAYCVDVEMLSEKERDTKKRKTNKDGASISEQDEQPQKMDKLSYLNWDEIETMYTGQNSKVPFSALHNFIRKWEPVNWEKNPWNVNI